MAPSTPSTPMTPAEASPQTTESPLSDLPQSPQIQILDEGNLPLSDSPQAAKELEKTELEKTELEKMEQEKTEQEKMKQEEYQEPKTLVAKTVSETKANISADLSTLRNTFAKMNHDFKHWESRINIARQHKENGEAILAAFGHVFKEQQKAIERYFNTENPDPATQKKDENPYQPYLDALIQTDNSMRAAVRAAQVELAYCTTAVEDTKQLAEFKHHAELAYLKTRSTLDQLQEAVQKAELVKKEAQEVEAATEGVHMDEAAKEEAQKSETPTEGVQELEAAKEGLQEVEVPREEVQTIEVTKEEIQTIEVVMEGV